MMSCTQISFSIIHGTYFFLLINETNQILESYFNISCFPDLRPFKIIITHFSSKQVHSVPLVVGNFINSAV